MRAIRIAMGKGCRCDHAIGRRFRITGVSWRDRQIGIDRSAQHDDAVRRPLRGIPWAEIAAPADRAGCFRAAKNPLMASNTAETHQKPAAKGGKSGSQQKARRQHPARSGSWLAAA